MRHEKNIPNIKKAAACKKAAKERSLEKMKEQAK